MKKILSLFAVVLFAGSMMAATEMTCADAAAAALGGSTDEVVVKGYVTVVSYAWSEEAKNMSFWIADDIAEGKVLQAYKCAVETQEKAPEVGDLVEVTGTLAKYNTTPELAEGCTVVIVEKGAAEPPAGADVEFTSAEFNGQGTSGSGSAVTATKNGVTFTCDKGYGDQYGVRCYKNSKVSIVSSEKQIGKIVFEFATVSGKTYDGGGMDPEVVVNGMEWSATMAEQARMNKISIYFGEAEPIEPVGLDTLSAKDALARAQALEVGATEKVAVLCYIANIKTPYDANYGNITVWLNDDPESTYGDIQAYRANCSAEDGEALAEHDRVLVVGKLSHTQNEAGDKDYYEIASGAQLTRLAAQGIENIILTEKVNKVIVDGNVYIVRDGKLFNMQGAQVR